MTVSRAKVDGDSLANNASLSVSSSAFVVTSGETVNVPSVAGVGAFGSRGTKFTIDGTAAVVVCNVDDHADGDVGRCAGRFDQAFGMAVGVTGPADGPLRCVGRAGKSSCTFGVFGVDKTSVADDSKS